MQHVPESVIQAPESPDAPEALPGCRSISDDDLCAWCTRLLYRPGEISLCRLSIQAMASGRIHTRAIHSIDTDIKLNRALWVMAETLLESLR
ncbi:hypothetical protein [Escherichia coli]|uniref:hypothetical protein n=1 Tax=Escherichia coli TaxID=562 RepID=UPI00398C55CA